MSVLLSEMREMVEQRDSTGIAPSSLASDHPYPSPLLSRVNNREDNSLFLSGNKSTLLSWIGEDILLKKVEQRDSSSVSDPSDPLSSRHLATPSLLSMVPSGGETNQLTNMPALLSEMREFINTKKLEQGDSTGATLPYLSSGLPKPSHLMSTVTSRLSSPGNKSTLLSWMRKGILLKKREQRTSASVSDPSALLNPRHLPTASPFSKATSRVESSQPSHMNMSALLSEMREYINMKQLAQGDSTAIPLPSSSSGHPHPSPLLSTVTSRGDNSLSSPQNSLRRLSQIEFIQWDKMEKRGCNLVPLLPPHSGPSFPCPLLSSFPSRGDSTLPSPRNKLTMLSRISKWIQRKRGKQSDRLSSSPSPCSPLSRFSSRVDNTPSSIGNRSVLVRRIREGSQVKKVEQSDDNCIPSTPPSPCPSPLSPNQGILLNSVENKSILLSQIRGGIQLKKVEQRYSISTPSPPALPLSPSPHSPPLFTVTKNRDTRLPSHETKSELLNQIREGIQLKKVEQRESPLSMVTSGRNDGLLCSDGDALQDKIQIECDNMFSPSTLAPSADTVAALIHVIEKRRKAMLFSIEDCDDDDDDYDDDDDDRWDN
ncbi:neural Wiskott-Aldrich syndrome protein-like isoform X1 [Solea senegalensis]|uniref:Neural Wiskott-Aldrich syndrome protein-like isoform X1 n=1 Tax=Solea senegalensis TaxID=28829 RepID=A0AAV6T3X0_SOLSE|nr:neural Wiskott-Aldrich syndrome protein-like isoform X1 [Solea senegalensis]